MTPPTTAPRHRATPGPRSDGQGLADQSAARHRARGRIPDLGRERAARGSRGCSAATRCGRARPSHSYGDFAATRTALDFLRSSSARTARSPTRSRRAPRSCPGSTTTSTRGRPRTRRRCTWSRTAITGAATGDRAFLDASWESIVRAWRFSAATDTDGNGLIENTHVRPRMDGGQPALSAARGDLPAGRVDRGLARPGRDGGGAWATPRWRPARARGRGAYRTAVEKTYWLSDAGYYAFATALAKPEKEFNAEAGPRRAERQARIEALRGRTIVDEDTVLPAVPLWWRTLDPERAQSQIDHLGQRGHGHRLGPAAAVGTERAVRPAVVSLGSVWPSSRAGRRWRGYHYGRPHVGYQALMANALLTDQGALGYVTELLSGRLQRAVRPFVASPGLVGGDGGDADRPRPAGHRGDATAAGVDVSLRSCRRTGIACR